MPNYCVNILVIDDLDPAFREILKQDGLRFNSLIPMPESATYEELWAAWGTKWDVGEPEAAADDLLRHGTVSFETAWSPPERYLKALATTFPDQSFELYFLEEGYEFCGVIRYRAGLDEEVDLQYIEREFDAKGYDDFVAELFGEG